MQRTVRQTVKKRKSCEARAGRAAVRAPWDVSTVDARAALVQALIPVALAYVGELLVEEVASFAGPRYARDDGASSRVRWGQQRGSIYLGHQKVGIVVPRVRD